MECVPIWGAFPFRGFLKGNLRASLGIVAGIAPFLSPPRNMVRGSEYVKEHIMNESQEREISTFDFRKYGKLTLTEKRLIGTIYSFQKTKQPQQQVGNTIAGNPGEVKVEHPIDATLDRISRINVNEGLLMGPVIYLWDAFVVLATIAAFRFIGNYMWSAVSWLQWFSLGMLYGIYWGHDWVRKWVNFHFMLDGAPYRVLVDKCRADEAERFVEAVRTARATGFSSATPLQAEAPRDKQIKIGMVIMSVGCVIALILACCSGGCGQENSGTGARMSNGGSSKYLKDVKTTTDYPELEMKIYNKAVRLMTSKVKTLGGGSALVDNGVGALVRQLQSSIREMSTAIPKDKLKMALESMYAELDDMINQ